MAQSHADRATTVLSRTTDGDGGWYKARDLMASDAAVITFLVYGTWGSGTITLEVADNSSGTNAVATSDTLTANGTFTVALSPDVYVNLALSGSSGASLTGTAM